MKKTGIRWAAVLLAAVLFAGCGGVNRQEQEPEADPQTEVAENPAFGGEILDDTAIFVFADEKLWEIMQELKAEYHMLRPTVAVMDSYGDPETLTEQIKAKEACDVFFATSKQQADELKEEGWIVDGSEQIVTEQGDVTYFAVRITNENADELERNAASDFAVFLLSDTAKEIYDRKL